VRETPVDISCETYLPKRDLKFVNGKKLSDDSISEWIVSELGKQLKAVEAAQHPLERT